MKKLFVKKIPKFEASVWVEPELKLNKSTLRQQHTPVAHQYNVPCTPQIKVELIKDWKNLQKQKCMAITKHMIYLN